MKSLEKVNFRGFIWPLIIGIILYAVTPFRPAGLSVLAWQMFAVFVATIVACITKPLPIGGTALVGLVATVLLGLTPVKSVVNPKTGAVISSGMLTAFSNSAVWLIAMAFIMARGISKTGLGNRIAFLLIKRFGRKSLGVAYAITGLELVTGALIPSNSARTGGIVWPIVQSISNNYASKPNDPSRKKIGSFLDFIAFHANILSSALFLTGAAPNLIAQQMAAKNGYEMNWMSWFLAGLIPVAIATAIIPIVIYKIYPPKIKETPNAESWAEDKLKEMGQMTLPEKIMSGVFIIAVIMWVLSGLIKLPQFDSTFVAFLAVGLLIITGVLSIKDVLNETGAWNILIWMSILIFMASKLTELGFIGWFSKTIQSTMKGISWPIVLAILVIVMFYSHYLFASQSSHVTALYLPFFAIALATGAPKALSAYLLAFTCAIMASTTHYSNGPASLLASTGYVTQNEWWKMNFFLGIIYLIIFGVVGTFWMKVIGMW